MFKKYFSPKYQTYLEPYEYKNKLVLTWSEDSEGWTAPLPQLSSTAEIYIGPNKYANTPLDSSCEAILRVLENIEVLNAQALEYLHSEAADFVSDAFDVNSGSFIPQGIQIFEHEKKPGNYSLVYNPEFDSGATWTVYFVDGKPADWGFDD